MQTTTVQMNKLYEAPQGEMGEQLADMRRELLRVDCVGRHLGMVIPPNLITRHSIKITPEMLPLIALSQTDIDTIIAQVPGGVSNIQDIYGLTPFQNGLMTTKDHQYTLVSRMRFIDRTSLERYAHAIQQMIERHDILRTAIFWDGLSEPAQVVSHHVPSLLSEIIFEESDGSVLDQLSQKFHPLRYSLDLTQAPLVRLFAAPGSERSWVAVQLMHHLISDYSMLENMRSEIHTIMHGNTEKLKTPAQFRDFVAQACLGINTIEHTKFFTEMLGDIDEPTLPFGLSEVDQDTSKMNEEHLGLSQTLTDQLRAHAQHIHVTLASICHLAWAQVVAKASGRESVVFGTVLLGRLQAGEENTNIMGPMINTLPLRLDIDEKSIEYLVRDTHVRLSALLTHEHAPLVLAQRCSGVPTGLPLFNSLMNCRHSQKSSKRNMSLPGVCFVENDGRTNYSLTISLDDDDDALSLSIQVTSPISAERVSNYIQQSLRSLVDVLARIPQHSARKLGVLPSEERTLLLHSWNQVTAVHSAGGYLHKLFEVQVDCNGQATALEFEGQILSYTQLNIQANQLAHYLISKDVKPDDRIALCVKRSTTLIVAMLGILKAGCAYVPLDPAYPSQRLTNILLDTDPNFLLADSIGKNALENHRIRTIDLEETLPTNLPIVNPDSSTLELTPAHLAYIIYTSGSTGTPKGVMVEHRNATSCLLAISEVFTTEDFAHTSFSTSVNFDMSLYECFASLSRGTTLHIMSNALAVTKSSSISLLSTIPSAVKTILNADSLPMSLHCLHLAGEPLETSLIRRVFEHTQVTDLRNLYGLTETTFMATMHRFKQPEDDITGMIGRPIDNVQIYLLDAACTPVLVGTMGEIYIGGATVARGYLNRPELSAERFLHDPFNNDPTARMYQSGDLARYLPDGSLIFLGRADQQVKIRGFRIEVGEIEVRLVEHPQVSEAVVKCCRDGTDGRLVAYVVTDAMESIAHNLRTHLSSLLPEYMVPAAYVCLPSLPLTPSGKLDRRALPDPDDDAFARQEYEAPQGDVEQKLADIWSELLNIERISRHDNFFALGGHSLLVVKLLAHLRRIGLDTTVRNVFDASTLTMLASNLVHYNALNIPPNLITDDSTKITPKMLPLIHLTQTDIDTIIASVPGGVANIQDIYGLTPLQSGMLFHHLMSKACDPYLMVSRIRFIDRKTLDNYVNAMQQLIERHDILRTAFVWDGLNEPAQVVFRQVSSFHTDITLNAFHEMTLNHLSQECSRLDLTQAPFLRLISAPESNGSWVALQLTHHTIIDGSTQQRLHLELCAIMNGTTEVLATPTPFREFVAQSRLGNNSDDHKRFFTDMLGDIDEPTIPFGLSDVDQDGSEINESYLELSQIFVDQLRVHARNLHVTLASICHLAWAQVVAKASGRESVVFGTVLLGRLQAGGENTNIMGPMINTLPLRLDIDERSTEIVVRDTHARLSALLAHEHAPLVLAQRCSGVSTGLPLFNSLLNYRHNQQIDESKMSLPGVRLVNDGARANYPLSISLDDDDSSLVMLVEVLSTVSASQICDYMHQALKSINEALSHTPLQPARKLTVIPAEERTLLLHKWNGMMTITQSPMLCLHQSFEAQVACDGQSIAVECEGQTLTYSELNVEANRLAHYLISKGVKPDDRIAVCGERSTTIIVAMLGILKAGCSYVPLDPVYSSQRLANILNDANSVFLLADTTGQKAFADHSVPVIQLNEPLPSDLRDDNPDTVDLGLTQAHLAYVIYTSGSTGTPKGVLIEHQQLAEYFEAIHGIFRSSKGHKWSWFHSFSFDFSVWEIWGALTAGCQLSLVPYSIMASATELYEWICVNGINMIGQTPSAFKHLLRVENFVFRPDQLLCIVVGGEELDSMIVREWFEKYDNGKTMVANTYGPTETVVDAAICLFDIKIVESAIYPIGRPLTNKRAYLLDLSGMPVPLGVKGEIYIGGHGIARGYLNRPELTAERFLPDPFSETPAARMYRSGDLARYLPDGNLVFLGRVDQQVKIRGFRIELGEIEARLAEHPQVKEATVQYLGSGSDARLVAYIVADEHESLAQKLRAYLSNLLPDYMVPAAYVCLPSLPLTPSGKLDRRALPQPDDDAFVRQQFEAPQGEVEQKLAEIWSELLNIERVSRHDNFFELGGHSLRVMQLDSKCKQNGIQIDNRAVFTFPILKNLAAQIDDHSSRCCGAAVPVRQYGNGTPLFLLPDGYGDVSYAFELAHDIDKNIPVYMLPWSLAEISKQPTTLEEMASSLLPFIKKVRSMGPVALAGYSAGGILAYEIAKQLMSGGNDVSFLGLIDSYGNTTYPISEAETFLTYLHQQFPSMKIFNDSAEWWDRLIELTLDETIEELRKMDFDFNNIDIEREVLASKQMHNYLKMCTAYKIVPLPIKAHLFKAKDYTWDKLKNRMDIAEKEELLKHPKWGWENTKLNVIPTNGNHFTLMTDAKNRSLLGKMLTKHL